jgi:hypothetical protein
MTCMLTVSCGRGHHYCVQFAAKHVKRATTQAARTLNTKWRYQTSASYSSHLEQQFGSCQLLFVHNSFDGLQGS